jgi:hypothetical protein
MYCFSRIGTTLLAIKNPVKIWLKIASKNFFMMEFFLICLQGSKTYGRGRPVRLIVLNFAPHFFRSLTAHNDFFTPQNLQILNRPLSFIPLQTTRFHQLMV